MVSGACLGSYRHLGSLPSILHLFSSLNRIVEMEGEMEGYAHRRFWSHAMTESESLGHGVPVRESPSFFACSCDGVTIVKIYFYEPKSKIGRRRALNVLNRHLLQSASLVALDLLAP